MAFRRGAPSNRSPTSSTTGTSESVPNAISSSSPTRPLLVPAGGDEETVMDEESQNHSAALMAHGMSSSPYINEESQNHSAALTENDLEFSEFEPTEDEIIKLRRSRQMWNLVVFSVGSAAFFFAFAAIVLYTSSFMFTCFVLPLVMGPYIIHQRRYLNKFPTLRWIINRLRFQVNRLQVQNNKFASENTRLEGEIQSLKKTEFALHQICQKSGSSIQEMQKLIKENGAIQKEMKKLQDAAELQELLEAILISDSNMDFVLSDEEMHRLTLRLRCFSVVDEERLKQALRMASTKSRYQYSPHPEERDVQIVSRGALSGVDGWMV